jgi:malate synthase
MDLKQLESLEARIKSASEDQTRAKGALEQIIPQAQKEFGVSTVEEARAKEEALLNEAAELDRKIDASYAEIVAEMDRAA